MKCVAGLAMGLSLAACNTYGYRGPNQIIAVNAVPAATRTDDGVLDIALFTGDYEIALNSRINSDGRESETTARMLRSGFMYNYSFCSTYFYRMAIRQRNAKVARRVLPPLSALITGVVGLQDFSGNPDTKERIVQSVALGSAFSTSLLDVYEEQFLYGTDNIDSVETLTLKALSVHREAVLAREDIGFEQAIQHLIDNQNLCSPQSVLTMARNAIKGAKVEPAAAQPATKSTADETGQIQITVGGS